MRKLNKDWPASAGLDAVSSFNAWWAGRLDRERYEQLCAVHTLHINAGHPDPHPAPRRPVNPFGWGDAARLWADGYEGRDLDRIAHTAAFKAEALWRSEWAS